MIQIFILTAKAAKDKTLRTQRDFNKIVTLRTLRFSYGPLHRDEALRS